MCSPAGPSNSRLYCPITRANRVLSVCVAKSGDGVRPHATPVVRVQSDIRNECGLNWPLGLRQTHSALPVNRFASPLAVSALFKRCLIKCPYRNHRLRILRPLIRVRRRKRRRRRQQQQQQRRKEGAMDCTVLLRRRRGSRLTSCSASTSTSFSLTRVRSCCSRLSKHSEITSRSCVRRFSSLLSSFLCSHLISRRVASPRRSSGGLIVKP